MADTPVFLLATAGMRLLPDSQRKNILAQICSFVRSNTKFQISSCDQHIQVISGETEGLYGWIAANYLLGGFDTPEEPSRTKKHHTFGFLDMGGASAQMAFAPNETEALRHAEDLKLIRMRTLNGLIAEYKVFVTTWLGFGANEARKRYVEKLLNAGDKLNPKTLPDPCLPTGLSISTKGDVFLPSPKTIKGKSPYLIGTGQFDKCLNQTYPLLEKDAICIDEPCLLNGTHVPAIDFDVNHFVGVSEYWHTTHEIFEKGHKDKAYDLNTYQKRVSEFCSQDWEKIEKGIGRQKWGKKVDEKTAVEVCFKASWLINILHEGIGIPRVGLENTETGGHNGTKEILHGAKEKGFTNIFQAVNKIGDTELSWTLGRMVLYASSQIPPLNDKSAVGFGSNVPSGIPPDFQYADFHHAPSSNSTAPHEIPSDPNVEDVHDTLFANQTPRRIPGFLLFILILCLAFYLLCGRDRRNRIYRKFARTSNSHHTRRRRFFAPLKVPLFNSSSGAYERVLEDGAAADQFELGHVDNDADSDMDADLENSDDSAGSWTVKSSGWATPRIVGGSAAVKGGQQAGLAFGSAAGVAGSGGGGSSGEGGYFDYGGGGLGLGIQANSTNPMGRSGLVGRTESRERLVTMGVGPDGGKRSRRASPTRGKSPGLGILSEF